MTQTVSDHIVQRMTGWGIERIFGYPGDGINGLMGALGRQERPDFVQTRHEEIAALAACAHAKFTGEVGVCVGTSGPGAIHLLNGLYDAKMDHQPVVAIVGQQPTTALGSDFHQEVDLQNLFKDVAHEFCEMVRTPAAARHIVDRAFRIARANRTVTAIILPSDIQEMDAVESPPRKHGSTFSGVGHAAANIIPKREQLDRAAEVLNAGEKVAILVGAGALGAREEVRTVAEVLGAGVAKALLGKAVISDDLPYVVGGIGLLGTKASWNLMKSCDTLLMIGTSFPYAEFLPEEGQARGVQIDIAPKMLSLRYPMEVNLYGDSAVTLRALFPLLKRKADRSWQEAIAKDVGKWWETVDARAKQDADPINPQRLFTEASPLLPRDSILTCDSGSAANWYARNIKMRDGMMGSLSGGLATMACAVPYAIAAKLAHPDRPVIAMSGDGAMQMLGNNGLITISRLWKTWRDPRLVVLVLNNRDLNQVTWEQRVMNGDPKFPASQDLPAFFYAGYAELLGLIGIKVTQPEHIRPAWEAALSADRPVVIDADCDPDVPPLPPHITLEQAKQYMFAWLKGDPDQTGTAVQTAKQAMAKLTHKKK